MLCRVAKSSMYMSQVSSFLNDFKVFVVAMTNSAAECEADQTVIWLLPVIDGK